MLNVPSLEEMTDMNEQEEQENNNVSSFKRFKKQQEEKNIVVMESDDTIIKEVLEKMNFLQWAYSKKRKMQENN